MAFNESAQATRLMETVGSYTDIATGMATMVGGKLTVTVKQLRIVQGVIGCAQGATGVGETVIVTATSGNTFDIETVDEAGDAAGTSVVMWMAWGKARN